MRRQLSLIKAGDWRNLYETYSPQFQNQCPYDRFLGDAATLNANIDKLKGLGHDQIAVRTEGDKAYATYITTLDGKDVEAVPDSSPDIYVKINGHWFDEVDEQTSCD